MWSTTKVGFESTWASIIIIKYKIFEGEINIEKFLCNMVSIDQCILFPAYLTEKKVYNLFALFKKEGYILLLGDEK